MTRDEKMEVVARLEERGAFLVKRSAEQVAEALDLSRFTIFSYLKEIRRQGGGEQLRADAAARSRPTVTCGGRHAAPPASRPDAATGRPCSTSSPAAGAATLAVIGLVKNAGKTTVVNALMDNVPAALRAHLARPRRRAHRPPHRPRQAAHRAARAARSSPPRMGSLDRSHYTMERARARCRSTPRWAASSSAAPSATAPSRSAVPPRSPRSPRTAARLHALRRRPGAGRRRHQPPRQRLAARERRASSWRPAAWSPTRSTRRVETTVAHTRDADPARASTRRPARWSSRTRRSPAPARSPSTTAARHRHARPRRPSSARASRVAREVERAGRRRRCSSAARSPRSSPTTSRARCRRARSVTRRRARRHRAHPARRRRSSRFRRRGIDLRVLTPLRVLAVTANPYRFPQPYNAKVFFGAVADAVGDRAPGLRRRPRPAGSAGRRRAGRSTRRLLPTKDGVTVHDAIKLNDDARHRALARRPTPSPTTSSATSTSTRPTRPSAPRCACWASPA